MHGFTIGIVSIRAALLRLLPLILCEFSHAMGNSNGGLADYYAAITFLDAQVGRILAALRASGQADNTLIVFSSDHGLAIGSHGLFGKQNLYDDSMHAPLIFAGPGVPKGKRTDAREGSFNRFSSIGTCGTTRISWSIER